VSAARRSSRTRTPRSWSGSRGTRSTRSPDMAVELEGRLEEVVDHGADTRSLFLRLPVDLDFRPGQFISCQLPVGDKTLIRPYSIASSPEEPRRLEILLNLVPGGPGSHYLFGLPLGATVRLTGPWGSFVLERAPEAETDFIADRSRRFFICGVGAVVPTLRDLLRGAGYERRAVQYEKW